VVLKVDGPTAPITDSQGNRRMGASASTSINRKDFGVNWSRALETGGVVAADEVKIEIDVQAIEKKGERRPPAA
jgi:polyisoprenoid-binding protein YceI